MFKLGLLPGECPAGQVNDPVTGFCTVLDEPDGVSPKSTLPANFWMYAGLGLLALLLLGGGFAGGRASKKSKSGSSLLSRTTTRSIFG